jgi:hypothetical protein
MQTFKYNHLFVSFTPHSPLRLYPVCLIWVGVRLPHSVCVSAHGLEVGWYV